MFVYILYSFDHDKFYIGHTNDVNRRLAEHNDSDATSWTASYQPWRIVHCEEHKDRSSAMEKESYLKSLKNKTRIQEYIAGWRNGTSGGS
ncbi:MAG: endonuclease [Parcubacteria group bacterium SW_4_46_8]|nr:MAG: endonuclease [Parcubacteria group bacterium SW_4_46_8]